MTIEVNKFYKIHLFIFSFIFIYLFLYLPVDFINPILAFIIYTFVLLHFKNIKFVYKKWYEKAIFITGSLYLTFAIFGLDLLLGTGVYNILRQNIVENLFQFFLGFVWTSYVLQSALDLICSLDNIKVRLCKPYNGVYWRKWLVLFFLMVAVFFVWLRAYNPVILFPDSWDFLAVFYGGKYIFNRSPLYTYIISIILRLAPTKPLVLWIAIAQIIIFSSLFTTILMYFHKIWIRFIYLIPFAIIIPLIPPIGIFTITVNVDLPCAMAILWLSYALIRIFDEMIINKSAGKKQQISLLIQLCLSLVFIYFLRPNSFLVYIITVPVLLTFFIVRKEWKLIAAVVLSVLIVFLIRVPGYNALFNPRHYNMVNNDISSDFGEVNSGEVNSGSNVNNQILHPGGGHFAAGIHDIQATYYAGGKFSEKTIISLRKHIKKLDDPEAIEKFHPEWVNFTGEYYDYNFSELTFNVFLSMYMDAFFNNPFKMLKSMFLRCQVPMVINPSRVMNTASIDNFTQIFDIFGGHDYQYIYSIRAPVLGVQREENFFTNIMDRYTNFMYTQKIPATFVWRAGFWTALMVISVVTLILQKRKIWLFMYLPIFVYLISMFLSVGWTEFRYAISFLLVGMFLPPALLLLKPSSGSNDDNKQEVQVNKKKKKRRR